MEKAGIRRSSRLRLSLPERLRIRRRGQSSQSPAMSGSIKSWLSLAWSLLGVVLVLLGVLILAFQVQPNGMLIEEFAVPEDLVKKGWTGRVVAKGLLDELQHIQGNATTRMKPSQFGSAGARQSSSSSQRLVEADSTSSSLNLAVVDSPATPVDLRLAGVSVPLAFLVRSLRDLLGIPTTQIDGEVLLEEDRILLITRVGGGEGKVFSELVGAQGQSKTIKHLLAAAAAHVFETTEPYILASFFCTTEDRRCLPTLERCLQNSLDHDDPWAYNLWGVVVMKKDPAGAIAKFQRAIALDPDFDLPYRNWGRVLLDQGKYGEAVAKMERAAELNGDAVSYTNLGLALLLHERADALEKLERAIELDPRYPNARLSLGVYHERRNNREKAVASLREAILVSPDTGLAYELLASLITDQAEADQLKKEGNRRKELSLRRAIAANPASGMSRCRLAAYLENDFQYEKAEAEYRAAIEVDATLAEAHNGLGGILLKYGRYDEAVDQFWKATDLDPELAVAYSNWGHALLKLDNHEQALARFQRAAALEPNSDNHLNVGVCLSRLNRLPEALNELRKAREKDRSSQIAIQNGCLVAKKLGETEAIREFCLSDQIRVASGTRSSAGTTASAAADASAAP